YWRWYNLYNDTSRRSLSWFELLKLDISVVPHTGLVASTLTIGFRKCTSSGSQITDIQYGSYHDGTTRTVSCMLTTHFCIFSKVQLGVSGTVRIRMVRLVLRPAFSALFHLFLHNPTPRPDFPKNK
ncbi:hypothetical protein HAX54_029813, partial [Datura stramonium]|nr:hypothetical protein [Datura stramonium]